MSKGYRFVGGPQHGQFRAMEYSPRYCDFPVYDEKGYGVARYERRPIVFDGFATVYVMALAGMGEAEFMRRCADIIEGV